VPLAFLTGVASDGFGTGEEVHIPASSCNDVVLVVPHGASISWAWGAASHDLAFLVDTIPLPDGVIAVPSAWGTGGALVARISGSGLAMSPALSALPSRSLQMSTEAL
jgi:hypothetical protein